LVAAADEEDDDIEQFVTRTIVQPPPPPPFNHTLDDVTDDESSYTDRDVIVTSDRGYYGRPACIDKTVCVGAVPVQQYHNISLLQS